MTNLGGVAFVLRCLAGGVAFCWLGGFAIGWTNSVVPFALFAIACVLYAVAWQLGKYDEHG